MPRTFFTQQEQDYIKAVYADNKTSVIAEHLNRPITSVYHFAFRNKLHKSKEFLSSPESGLFIKNNCKDNGHRFVKGQISHNKGKKMPADVYEKAKATMFKKGHLPHNTKYDGALRVQNEKGINYIYVRISQANWQPLHRVIWEKYNGKIEKGYNVIFKDKNTSNITLSNLELISNHELMLRNSIQNYPVEIKSLMLISGKLKRQINKILNDE
jgi:hypothetical protein